MANRCTVGLIGCGRWGRHILRDLQGLGCDVIVVAPSEASRQTAAAESACDVVSHLALLPIVQGIVVASPTNTHAAVIEELLPRQVPIFTEKPLTVDPKSARRLANLGEGRLFVMDKWRYHPGIEMLAQISRDEELGPVQGLRTTRVNWGNPHLDVDGVWILAPHDLSVALEVLGTMPTPVSAVSHRVDDECAGLLGVLGKRPWFVMEISTAHRDWRREFTLYCRDGVALLSDGYSDHVQITRFASTHDMTVPPVEKRLVSTELPLLRELRAFVEHLQGGPPPRSSAAEGALIVETLAALRQLAGP